MAAAPKETNAVAVKGSSQEGASTLFQLDGERTDLGRPDTLRFNILTWVLEENYDRAIQELKDFSQKPSPYPTFQERVERYLMHSVDLIFAIKAKRNFPGINSLTRAKQQELREKFKQHFRELRIVLMKVEKIETDLRIEDVRSTIYVVRALSVAVVIILSLSLLTEIFQGLAQTVGIVVDDGLSRALDSFLDLIGF